MNWVESHLFAGYRWELGGQGPEAFDCWGFVRFIQRQHFGRELPALDIGAAAPHEIARAVAHARTFECWHRVPDGAPLRDGDVFLMDGSHQPDHVGVWAECDGGGVLHCMRGAGVVWSPLARLSDHGFTHWRVWRFEE